MFNRLKDRSGFTLVEAMVSMLILGITVLVASIIFNITNSMHSQAEQRDRSYMYARQKMLQLQSDKRAPDVSGEDTLVDSKNTKYVRTWRLDTISGNNVSLKGVVTAKTISSESVDSTTITALVPRGDPRIRLDMLESGQVSAAPDEDRIYLGYMKFFPEAVSIDTLELTKITVTAIDTPSLDEADDLVDIRFYRSGSPDTGSSKSEIGSSTPYSFGSNDSGSFDVSGHWEIENVTYIHVFCDYVVDTINIPSNLKLMVDFEAEIKDSGSAPKVQRRGTDFKLSLPSADFTVDPDTVVLTDFTITFDGTGSYSPNGDIIDYSWDFGDGSSSAGGADSVVTHAYDPAGTYTVSLIVTDDSSRKDTVTQDIVVYDPVPPVASISTDPDPAEGVVTFTVDFDGSGSYDPDGGSIVSYSWDVGLDGEDATTMLYSHEFTTAGTSQVSLTVYDDEGDSASDTVNVNALSSPPPPQNILTIYSAGDGTVDPEHKTGGSYNEDTTISVSTSPGSGNQFYKWSGDTLDGSTDASPDIVMDTNYYVIADFRADSELAGTDIITNGDFTDRNNNWGVNFINGATGGSEVDSGALRIHITGSGSNKEDVQAEQEYLEIKNDYTYRVSFIARAEASKTIHVEVSNSSEYGGKDITLSDTYQKFSFAFEMSNSTDNSASLCFNGGDDDTDYWIDNVVVSEVSPCAENDPPTAAYIDVVPSSGGDVNTDYEFDASRSTDPDGNIDIYSWDFGDGSSETGDTVYHSYDSADTYTVTLTVIDECGDSLTNDKNVEVAEGGGEGGCDNNVPYLEKEVDITISEGECAGYIDGGSGDFRLYNYGGGVEFTIDIYDDNMNLIKSGVSILSGGQWTPVDITWPSNDTVICHVKNSGGSDVHFKMNSW